VAILDRQKMQYQIFCKFLIHFCMHFDFSPIFQALKTPAQNAKSTFFGDFYVKEEEMLFSNVA